MIRCNVFYATLLTALLVISSGVFVSCGKEKTPEPEIVLTDLPSLKKKVHQWFYFTPGGFSVTDLPQNAPAVPAKPWTEAVRISSASATSNEDNATQKGYMVVNRLGMLILDGAEAELCRDQSLFTERTAGNLVFLNGTPLFSLYKSTFFNDNTKDNQHPFLVQFDPASKISFPLVNCDNLTETRICEVTDFIWDGRTWLCCIKSEENSKTEFSYIKWTSKIPLLNQSPVIASDNITIEESSVDDFRLLKEPLPFSSAPERIKKLLNGLASSVPFTLSAFTAGGTSPRYYSNVAKEDESALTAYGIISQTWSGIMFQEGTIYLEGALDGRRILRNGKPVAIRLPRLPYGYNYTNFTISGTTLYAAWEESDFYMTSRSGFLKVDLDETLYKAVR